MQVYSDVCTNVLTFSPSHPLTFCNPEDTAFQQGYPLIS